LKGIYSNDEGHNYKTYGSLPRCDRVTVVADSEHCGEKIPFCNQPEPEPKTIEILDHKGIKRKVENFARFNYPKVILTHFRKMQLGIVVLNGVS
jgi:hypothetical protein